MAKDKEQKDLEKNDQSKAKDRPTKAPDAETPKVDHDGAQPSPKPVKPDEPHNVPAPEEQLPSWAMVQVDTNEDDWDNVDVSKPTVEVPEQFKHRPKVAPVKQNAKGAASPNAQASNGSEPPRDDRNDDNDDQNETHHIPRVLGLLALRNAVVFPGTVIPLAIGRPRSRRLLSKLASGELNVPFEEIDNANNASIDAKPSPIAPENIIGVITQREPSVDDPGYDDLYPIGAVATVVHAPCART